jgi:hypothetical protein
MLICIVALYVCCEIHYAATEDYWGDEAFTVRRIQAPWRKLYYPFIDGAATTSDPFDLNYVYDFNPPGYFVLARLLLGSQPQRLGLRAISLLSLLATFLLLYRYALRPLPPIPRILSALLFFSSPAAIYYGHEARPYALGILCVALALVVCLHGPLRRGRSVLLALLFCLSLSVHFYTAFAWLGLLVYFSVLQGRRLLARGVYYPFVAALLAGGAATLLLLWPYRSLPALVKFLPTQPVGGRSVLFALAPPLQMANAPTWLLSLALPTLVACLVPLFARRNSSSGSGLCLAVWLLAALGPLAAHLLGGVSCFDRYALFAFPALLWLLARGLQASRWVQVPALLLLAIQVTGHFPLGASFRPRWRPAIDYVARHSTAADYYTIDPKWLILCFAANAHVAPPARYLALGQPVPLGSTLFLLSTTGGSYQATPGSGHSTRRVSLGGEVQVWEIRNRQSAAP